MLRVLTDFTDVDQARMEVLAEQKVQILNDIGARQTENGDK